MINLQQTLDEARSRFGPLLPPGTVVHGLLAAVDFDCVNTAATPLFAMLPDPYLVKKCSLAITSAGLLMVASQWAGRVEHWAVEGVPWASIEEILEPQSVFAGDRAPMNVKLKSGGTIRFVCWPKLESPGAAQYLQLTRQTWANAGGRQSPTPPSIIAHLGVGQTAAPVRESPPMDPAVKAKWVRRAVVGGGVLAAVALVGGAGAAIIHARSLAEHESAREARRARDQQRHAEVEADAARFPAHAPLAPVSTPASPPSLASLPDVGAATAALSAAGFEVTDRGAPPATVVRWRLEAQGRCGQWISLTAVGPTPYPFHATSAQCATGAAGTLCAEARVTPRDCVFDPTVREDDPARIQRRRTANADWARWALHRVLGP
jgi:hypothetical protein